MFCRQVFMVLLVFVSSEHPSAVWVVSEASVCSAVASRGESESESESARSSKSEQLEW